MGQDDFSPPSHSTHAFHSGGLRRSMNRPYNIASDRRGRVRTGFMVRTMNPVHTLPLLVNKP